MSTTHRKDPQSPTGKPQVRLLRCPCCGRETRSLKRYRMLHLFLFLYVFYSAQAATYTSCPGCMRKYVLWRMFVNVFASNLVWPISVGPWGAILLLMTFIPGHSGGVERAMEDERRAAQALMERLRRHQQDAQAGSGK